MIYTNVTAYSCHGSFYCMPFWSTCILNLGHRSVATEICISFVSEAAVTFYNSNHSMLTKKHVHYHGRILNTFPQLWAQSLVTIPKDFIYHKIMLLHEFFSGARRQSIRLRCKSSSRWGRHFNPNAGCVGVFFLVINLWQKYLFFVIIKNCGA